MLKQHQLKIYLRKGSVLLAHKALYNLFVLLVCNRAMVEAQCYQIFCLADIRLDEVVVVVLIQLVDDRGFRELPPFFGRGLKRVNHILNIKRVERHASARHQYLLGCESADRERVAVESYRAQYDLFENVQYVPGKQISFLKYSV